MSPAALGVPAGGTTHAHRERLTMRKFRRAGAIVAAVALVAILALGTVGAAGFGTFVVSILGGGSQQGAATITGVCQDGDPVTVDFSSAYTAGQFVIDGITLTGVNAACVDGSLVLNDDGGTIYNFAIVAGEADVPLAPPVELGGIDKVDVLLNQ